MNWHYSEGGQQTGPVTEDRLFELARNGIVTPETLVWHAGMEDWKAFRDAAPGVPPPIPREMQAATLGQDARACGSCARTFALSELALFGDTPICADCKPAWVQRLRQGMVSTGRRYAGFWIRLGAQAIDSIIFLIIEMIFLSGAMINYFRAVSSAAASGGRITTEQANTIGSALGPVWLIIFALHLVYSVFFVARFGATPGKMACGLKIVDAGGGKVSIGQSVGRYFAFYLSGILLYIGYLMAAWDPEKRALHDRLAGTRVIRIR